MYKYLNQARIWEWVKQQYLQIVLAMVGLALVLVGAFAALVSAVEAVLLTLGATFVSASVVGFLLNIVWWHNWTKRALVSLFQDPEMLESIGLDQKRLRDRFIKVLCAIYGSKEKDRNVERLLRRDILERLVFPVRKAYTLTYRLDRLDHPEFILAETSVTVDYKLHYESKEATENPPFPSGQVMTGYIDIPDVLLAEWERRMSDAEIDDKKSDGARKLLSKLVVDDVPLLRFRELYMHGKPCKEGEDYTVHQIVDGTKPEPSIDFSIEYTGAPRKPGPGEDVEVRYVYSLIDNMFGYYFKTMQGLTDGLRAHLSFEPDMFKADLRYLLPSYWEEHEKLITQSRPGEVDLAVNAMMLAGHALLVTWYAKDIRLSKRQSDEWLMGTRTDRQ